MSENMKEIKGEIEDFSLKYAESLKGSITNKKLLEFILLEFGEEATKKAMKKGEEICNNLESKFQEK